MLFGQVNCLVGESRALETLTWMNFHSGVDGVIWNSKLRSMCESF